MFFHKTGILTFLWYTLPYLLITDVRFCVNEIHPLYLPQSRGSFGFFSLHKALM